VLANGGWDLTLILLTWTKWWAPTSASKWRMGFNSVFKGLKKQEINLVKRHYHETINEIKGKFRQ
jgi:hypothetical protein